jgi:hypothetical protein
MKREDDRQLWDFLGRAVGRQPSPFFARNVLREVRRHNARFSIRSWLRPRRLIPATSLALALIAVVLLRLPTAVSNYSSRSTDPLAGAEAQDTEIIADLDDLLAADDGNSSDETVLL